MALSNQIASIRINYSKKELTEASVLQHPVEQFQRWLNEAIEAAAQEPTAFVLSTVSANNRPTARVVLLKDVTLEGFTFFTNYESRKGQDLANQPFAAATFFWPELERQVRIEGEVRKVDPAFSDSYYHSRPLGSQIGAWASPQSQEIVSREELEQADKHFTEKFEGLEQVPRPPHWGGYTITPAYIEFWQGRQNRLHDRLVYELDNGSWKTKRLAP